MAPRSIDPIGHPLPGLALVLAIGALLASWLLLLRRASSWTVPQLRATFAAWGAPLFLGPPLLSSDLTSYVAQGQLLLMGRSPYVDTPLSLPAGSALAAVDPRWRDVHSPYGPLASWIEYLAVQIAHGHTLFSALLLRAVAVGSIVIVGYLLWQMATPACRPIAVALTALNPLFMLHLGSAAHLDGLLCVCAVGALAALRFDRLNLALALSFCAGLVKAPGFVLVAVVLVAAWLATPPAERCRRVGLAFGTGVLTTVGISMLVPNGWGWLAQVSTPALGLTPAAPASLLAYVMYPFLVSTGAMPFESLMSVCRVIALVAGCALILALVRTSRRRPVTETAGLVLLAVSLFGPVLYPWYLVTGIACLAVTFRGRRGRVLVALSCVGSLMAVQGLSLTAIVVVAVLVVIGGSVATAFVLCPALRPGHHRHLRRIDEVVHEPHLV